MWAPRPIGPSSGSRCKQTDTHTHLFTLQMPAKLRERFTTGAAFGTGGTTLTEAGYDLLSSFLAWDPERRISAQVGR